MYDFLRRKHAANPPCMVLSPLWLQTTATRHFSGTPTVHLAMGALFSAMEVVPLVLLSYEAWRFMRLGAAPGSLSLLGTGSADFPYEWAGRFLIAAGFWNFLGAGVFRFLINLPVVSYYEMGTKWTANHGHAALMGVYGMLAMGFFMFVARYFIPRDRGCERAMASAFWSMNIASAGCSSSICSRWGSFN